MTQVISNTNYFNIQYTLLEKRSFDMKTRAQRKREEEEEEINMKPVVKKTKKELLEEKNALKVQQASGKAGGKKKIKEEQKPVARTRRAKQQAIRIYDHQKDQSKKKNVEIESVEKKTRNSTRLSAKQSNDELEARTRKQPQKSDQKQNKEEAKRSSLKISAKSDLKEDKEPEKQEIKTVQFKGKVPIDEYCELKNTSNHILQYKGKVYSATLNQTNMLHNNNKYYILQIIQRDNSSQCYFFTRWGRVGVKGQQSLQGPYPINVAISQYNSKYRAKSSSGDYCEIELNYEAEDEKDDKGEEKDDVTNNKKRETDFEKSSLPTPLKSLIDLIFDLKMMSKQMFQIGFDTKKMPLGKLAKSSILKGYKYLQQLLEEVAGKKNNQKIIELSSKFYTFIPHNFGFENVRRYTLDTEQKVKQKIEMLEALAEIKVAAELIKDPSTNQNQLDSNYKKLNREITPIDNKTAEFELINKYLQSTHGQTHTSYQLELVNLFSLSSQVENIRYTKHIPNKMLLWHGSRLTNFVGILSQGLRIAPPQAPVTGYMFGKGVYFADMSSKSANYCFTSNQNNTGILLLCEVALGEMNEKFSADYYAGNLPPGKYSTKGVGKIGPNPTNQAKLDDGVVIPMGPGESVASACSLVYNEFIVYDIAQIRVRYLLRTKFNYKN